MKNITLLILGLAVILGGILWYLKPVEASKPASNTVKESTLPQEQQQITSTNQQQSFIEGAQPNLNSSASEVGRVDTKSDLSIQPIDPDTDTGNQILKNN